jgi:hypothetical protein
MYLMFKGVFDSLPYLSSEMLKKKREGNMGERGEIIFATVVADLEHLCAYGFFVFNSLVITILKDEFLSINNRKQYAFKHQT